jgi:4-amino-4-deoxy-L-arabinose transferase-like glycosyltransferase
MRGTVHRVQALRLAVKEPAAHRALLLFLVFAGAGLRLWGIDFGLPHPMARPDEEFIVSVALRFFSGDYNPHFFEWPTLYFYVVHACFRAVYTVGHLTGAYPDVGSFTQAIANDPTWAHLALRLMSAGAGTATLIVTHSIAKSLFDGRTALLATAFLAVAYLHVRDSHFGVLDVPLTLFVVVALRLLLAAWNDKHPVPWFAGAGACTGLAVSVKYNAAALLVPGLVTCAIMLADSPRAERRAAAVGLTAFLVACVACFLIGSPYVVLDSSSFRAGIEAQFVRLTEGHGVQIEHVWLRHLTFSLWYGLGFPVLVAGVVGAVLLISRDWRRGSILCAFPLSYFVVIGGGHTAFIRYTTPLVPFFCVLAAYAVCQLIVAIAGRLSKHVRTAVTVVTVLLFASPSLILCIRFDRLLTERDTRLMAAEWLAANIRSGESLYESGASYARPHYAWPPGTLNYVSVELDPRAGTFVTSTGERATPGWIVLAESPLRLYTRVPSELRGIISAGYELVHAVAPSREPEPEAAFDRQDAFFLPYADFSVRERPGPQFSIYRRSATASAPEPRGGKH